MFARQVRLARGISKFLESSREYELLPLKVKGSTQHDTFEETHIIVIFRAIDERKNAELVKKINATRKMYVSGTKWDSKPACRIAVSTWRVCVDRDLELATNVLTEVVAGSS
jgi:hypothetical protein